MKVGPTGRYLVDQRGTPFLVTGDAAWSLIAQLSDSDADSYLHNRQQLGFNVVLVELIEHKFSTKAPADIYGIRPFAGKGFATPNEAYFAHADYIIQSAARRGIVVLLDPLYLGYGCGDEGWCAEVKAASSADLMAWGRYVGERYRNYDNIIWVIGGDMDPAPVKSHMATFVNGILSVDRRHLFTAHNGGEQMAVAPWSGASWLNLNAIYTYDSATYESALPAYHLSPARPFFLIEDRYEGESPITQQQLRAQAYYTVLSGGTGSIFGNCPIWGFGDPQLRKPCTPTTWQRAMTLQGSINMKHFHRLFGSRHFYSLVPDESHAVVTAGYGRSGQPDYVTVAAASDGSSIIAYLPDSTTLTVTGRSLSGRSMTGWWYNPSTGAATLIGTYPTTGAHNLAAPARGDWVLVVDSRAFRFRAPGR